MDEIDLNSWNNFDAENKGSEKLSHYTVTNARQDTVTYQFFIFFIY
jgi:hypothetical protein